MSRSAAKERKPVSVIYVHGLGPKPAAAVLQSDWDYALFGGPGHVRTCMAYWADVRHPDSGKAPRQPDRTADTWRDRLEQRWTAAIPRNVNERLRRLMTNVIVRRFLPDVAAYFFDAGVRDAIQSRLLTALLTPSGPLVVVAHSMGTMLAYDVLHALGDAIDVRLWVTLGSPLGIAAVQDHLAQPLSVPGGVRAWCNFADRFDPVALDRTLSSEFEPPGFISDEWIINAAGIDPEGFNPHSGTGYLSHPAVRSAVMAAMG
jgi:hypothetical protein